MVEAEKGLAVTEEQYAEKIADAYDVIEGASADTIKEVAFDLARRLIWSQQGAELQPEVANLAAVLTMKQLVLLHNDNGHKWMEV